MLLPHMLMGFVWYMYTACVIGDGGSQHIDALKYSELQADCL